MKTALRPFRPDSHFLIQLLYHFWGHFQTDVIGIEGIWRRGAYCAGYKRGLFPTVTRTTTVKWSRMVFYFLIATSHHLDGLVSIIERLLVLSNAARMPKSWDEMLLVAVAAYCRGKNIQLEYYIVKHVFVFCSWMQQIFPAMKCALAFPFLCFRNYVQLFPYVRCEYYRPPLVAIQTSKQRHNRSQQTSIALPLTSTCGWRCSLVERGMI